MTVGKKPYLQPLSDVNHISFERSKKVVN